MRFKIFVLFLNGLVAAQTYDSMIDRMMAQLRDRRTKMLMSWSKSTTPRSHFKLVEYNHADGNEEDCDNIEKRTPAKQFRQIFWEMNPEKISKVRFDLSPGLSGHTNFLEMMGNDVQGFGQDIFGYVVPPMPMGKPLPNDQNVRFLQQEKDIDAKRLYCQKNLSARFSPTT